jgi:hypothetical protein
LLASNRPLIIFFAVVRNPLIGKTERLDSIGGHLAFFILLGSPYFVSRDSAIRSVLAIPVAIRHRETPPGREILRGGALNGTIFIRTA